MGGAKSRDLVHLVVVVVVVGLTVLRRTTFGEVQLQTATEIPMG